jgi:hypothetical protein
MRDVFPDSPVSDMTEALMALVEGDKELLKEKLKAAATKLSPECSILDRWEEFLVLIHDLQRITIRINDNEGIIAPPGVALLDPIRGGFLLFKVKQFGQKPGSQPFGLPVPVVGLIQKRFCDVYSLYIYGKSTKAEIVLPSLEAVNNDYRDAGLLLLAAVLHMRKAVVPVNQGNVAESREQFERTAELCSQSVQAPGILPPSSAQYQARAFGLLADTAVLKQVKDSPVHLQRVRDNFHLLTSEGARWPKTREQLITFFIKLTAAPLVREQCGDWNIDDAMGRQAFEKRKQILSAVGRSLLEAWSIDEVDNPLIPQLHSDLKKWETSSGIMK